MPVTVIDVSRRAGCSPATVSRVLNNSGPVSESVRQRVLQALAEEGYVRKDPPARTAKGNRPALTAVGNGVVDVILCRRDSIERVSVSDDGVQVGPAVSPSPTSLRSPAYRLSNAFFQHIVDGVLQELREWKTPAIVQVTHDPASPDILADLGSADRRGVILIGEYSPSLPRFVEACPRPLVLVDLLHRGWPDVVAIDSRGGIAAAVEHLLELGHRDIGFLGGDPANAGNRERRISFCWQMAAAGLPVRQEWISEGSNHIEEATTRAAALLRQRQRPTALVCFNDCIALGALRAAQQIGLRVPEALSVVGFDDIDVAAFTTPPLTTVRVPTLLLGRYAAQQLLLRSASPQDTRDEGGCEILVRTELIVRESTAAPRR